MLLLLKHRFRHPFHHPHMCLLLWFFAEPVKLYHNKFYFASIFHPFPRTIAAVRYSSLLNPSRCINPFKAAFSNIFAVNTQTCVNNNNYSAFSLMIAGILPFKFIFDRITDSHLAENTYFYGQYKIVQNPPPNYYR